MGYNIEERTWSRLPVTTDMIFKCGMYNGIIKIYTITPCYNNMRTVSIKIKEYVNGIVLTTSTL